MNTTKPTTQQARQHVNLNAHGQDGQQSELIELEPAEVRRMIAEGAARLIDVREAGERRRCSIVGSDALPLGECQADRVDCDHGPMPVFHCHRGGRSLKALQRMHAGGKTRVAHMRGGIEAWMAAGLPVIEDKRAPLSSMQQTQILMGVLVLVGVVLGALWSPWALVLSGFIGCGMIFAGITGSCAMANMLEAMPWNRHTPANVACRI
jgi:rhodanese-related sulfurtransferase